MLSRMIATEMQRSFMQRIVTAREQGVSAKKKGGLCSRPAVLIRVNPR
jgi:hypothetical protein